MRIISLDTRQVDVPDNVRNKDVVLSYSAGRNDMQYGENHVFALVFNTDELSIKTCIHLKNALIMADPWVNDEYINVLHTQQQVLQLELSSRQPTCSLESDPLGLDKLRKNKDNISLFLAKTSGKN